MTLQISTLLRSFCREEDGGTGMEYALIAAGLAITVLASVQLVSRETQENFENVATSFPPIP